MTGQRVGILVSLSLGVLSVFAVYVCHLALTDIYHLEPDVTAEWRAVQICFVVIIAFQVSALVTLWQVLRSRRTGATGMSSTSRRVTVVITSLLLSATHAFAQQAGSARRGSVSVGFSQSIDFNRTSDANGRAMTGDGTAVGSGFWSEVTFGGGRAGVGLEFPLGYPMHLAHGGSAGWTADMTHREIVIDLVFRVGDTNNRRIHPVWNVGPALVFSRTHGSVLHTPTMFQSAGEEEGEHHELDIGIVGGMDLVVPISGRSDMVIRLRARASARNADYADTLLLGWLSVSPGVSVRFHF